MDNGLDSFQRAMGMDMDSDPNLIYRYKRRSEVAEKRVAELEEALREAICEIGQSCGGCGDYKEDKCISYRDCWVKDAIRAIHIALAHTWE